MSWGTRENIRKHKKGYGGKAEFIATVKKQNKKPTFVAECSVCKAQHYFVIPKRMKKAELVAV
jgi:ribosomal protein L44E